MKILFNRKSILFVTVLMFSAILIVFSSGSANAVPIWGSSALGELSGSRSSSDSDEIVATGDWRVNGFEVSWNITQSGNFWTYDYTVVGDRKELSHFILEVTEDDQPFIFTSDQIDYIGADEPKTFTQSGGETLPNPIYGVKFDIGGSTTMLYSLTTNRAPVYGVFWAVDGTDDVHGDGRVLAYSKALDFSDYKTNQSLAAKNFIVRPDSVSVPEPTTMLLLGTALFGLVVARRRFKK